jgi:hypothetical protein
MLPLNALIASVISLPYSTPLLIALLVDSLWFKLPPARSWPVTVVSMAMHTGLVFLCALTMVSPEPWGRYYPSALFISLICVSAAISRLVPSLIARRWRAKS